MSMNSPSGAPTVDLETLASVQATAPTSVEEVRERVDKLGIEFLFAQFVDMHGKPNAEARAGDPPRRTVHRRRRVCGFRRR